jgi:hypothetical protein
VELYTGTCSLQSAVSRQQKVASRAQQTHRLSQATLVGTERRDRTCVNRGATAVAQSVHTCAHVLLPAERKLQLPILWKCPILTRVGVWLSWLPLSRTKQTLIAGFTPAPCTQGQERADVPRGAKRTSPFRNCRPRDVHIRVCGIPTGVEATKLTHCFVLCIDRMSSPVEAEAEWSICLINQAPRRADL